MLGSGPGRPARLHQRLPPAVSVITSISFDHTRQLGDTLAAIAGEKAGIVKRGVPVVSGVTADEPREVIRADLPPPRLPADRARASISTSPTARRGISSCRGRPGQHGFSNLAARRLPAI